MKAARAHWKSSLWIELWILVAIATAAGCASETEPQVRELDGLYVGLSQDVREPGFAHQATPGEGRIMEIDNTNDLVTVRYTREGIDVVERWRVVDRGLVYGF